MRRHLAGPVGVLALYAAVVAWLTWPLLPRVTTHLANTSVPCGFDLLQMAWVLAYQSHRLVTAPLALPDANIYHPAPHTLFYGETAFGALPFFLPVFLVSGNPALSINATFLASLVLTASALHLVVVRWTGSHAGALVAACCFLTTPWVLRTWVPFAVNYAVLPYLPVVILLASTSAGRRSHSLRLLALAVLQGLTTIYAAAATLGPLALIALARLVRRATRRAGLALAAAVALAGVILTGVYAGQLVVRAENPTLRRQTFWPLAVHKRTKLPEGLFDDKAPTGIAAGAFVLICAGALSRLRRSSPADDPAAVGWRHAAFWAVTGAAMSLTPTVEWGGTAIPLPQRLVARLVPVYEGLREPARLGMAGLVGLALLAGLAFAECATRLRARRGAAVTRGLLAVLVLAAMYVQYARPVGLAASYPLQEAIAPNPQLLALLRADRGPLLELPVPPPPAFPVAQARATYRSIFHWRPILNGYTGYFPRGFPERMATARRLPAPEALADLRREAGLETVLVHAAELPRSEIARWENAATLSAAFAAARPDLPYLVLAGRDGDDMVFTVVDATSAR